jgi:hypothetical protein
MLMGSAKPAPTLTLEGKSVALDHLMAVGFSRDSIRTAHIISYFDAALQFVLVHFSY